jgi:hypothetical protein
MMQAAKSAPNPRQRFSAALSKRRVRDRARKTGESYSAALAPVRRRPEQELCVSDPSPTTPGQVLVVTGPPGVGKSTVSALIAAAFERSVHLKADDFMASVVSGWVDPADLETCWSRASGRAEGRLSAVQRA